MQVAIVSRQEIIRLQRRLQIRQIAFLIGHSLLHEVSGTIVHSQVLRDVGVEISHEQKAVFAVMILDKVSHLLEHLDGLTGADIVERIGDLLVPGVIEQLFFTLFLHDSLQPFRHVHEGLCLFRVIEVLLALQESLGFIAERQRLAGHQDQQQRE